MSSSVGMMTLTIYIYIWKNNPLMFQTTNQIIIIFLLLVYCWFIAYSPLLTMTTKNHYLAIIIPSLCQPNHQPDGISISGMSSTLGFTTSPSTAADTSASSEVTSVSAWWKKWASCEGFSH
jgi:hypothetical protein